MTRPLVAIGLDAADPDLVAAWMDDGTLPTLARLRDEGAWGDLGNVARYRAETPWTTFLTGCLPETVGYWGPIRHNAQTGTVDEQGAYDFQRFPPFYAGRGRVCVFDMPQTRLRADVDGLQALGWGSHSQQGPLCSQPPGLLDALIARHGDSPVYDRDHANAYDAEALKALAVGLSTAVARRAGIVHDLLSRERWDLFLTMVGETHSGGHSLWHVGRPHPLFRGGVDHVRALYAGADAVVATALAAAPDDARVVVFSAHGMEPNVLDVPSMAFLPELLARWQFGRAFLAEGTSPPGPFVAEAPKHWKFEVWDRRTPAGAAALEGPHQQLSRGDVLNWQPASWYRPLWPRMRAFALPSYSDGTIRLNVAGRDRGGMVAPADVGAVREELIALLRGVVDARTGAPVVDDVLVVESEPGRHRPPADLIVRWSSAAITDAVAHPDLGVVGPLPWFRTGSHRSRGFWIARGDGIPAGATLPEGRAPDLTASLLHLMGHAPDPWMDGRSVVPEAWVPR